jgi:RNA polymerase sigma factor FliA
MISLEGVTSELVARNESWVRKQAQQMAHRLPANVERADLIQAGLIAVAQASLSFRWEDHPGGPEAQEHFVRYARQRVRGAMLDELRQMDVLARGDRRKVKLVQIARERWLACNGAPPSLSVLSELTGFEGDAIRRLDRLVADQKAAAGNDLPPEHDEAWDTQHPVTERDEVEARVDTAIVMRHLEAFFARLPERDRRVIDAYLGVGLSPVELAASLQITPSRVSSLYRSVLRRLSAYFDLQHQRATDRPHLRPEEGFEALVEQRERVLHEHPDHWTDVMDDMLGRPDEAFQAHGEEDNYIVVRPGTRWG